MSQHKRSRLDIPAYANKSFYRHGLLETVNIVERDTSVNEAVISVSTARPIERNTLASSFKQRCVWKSSFLGSHRCGIRRLSDCILELHVNGGGNTCTKHSGFALRSETRRSGRGMRLVSTLLVFHCCDMSGGHDGFGQRNAICGEVEIEFERQTSHGHKRTSMQPACNGAEGIATECWHSHLNHPSNNIELAWGHWPTTLFITNTHQWHLRINFRSF